MKQFVDKHMDKIIGTLTCFDRIIFKGYLPISSASGMAAFFHNQQWLIKDFKKQAPAQSIIIKEHMQALAEKAGRPFLYPKVGQRKEDLARRIAQRDNITEGFICICCALEACSSFKIAYQKGRPQFQAARRKCNYYYLYYMDREFGLMHIRLQSWFPFSVQIYINGHEWLARKMDRHGIKYKKVDNAFLHIDQPQRVQRFADNLCKKNWPRILGAFARRANPHLSGILKRMQYYWVTDQCETAIDIMFRSRQALKDLYQKLLRHATLCFSAEDVLTFLGRKLHGCFKGEILNDFKVRIRGARIKHRMKDNWIKMYDKYGIVLRIETVINRPHEFKVRRRGIRKGRLITDWFPMAKRVTNLPRYYEVSRNACRRYLNALSVVDDPTEAFKELNRLCESVKRSGRTYRGLNPLRKDDSMLLRAIMQGRYHVQGFRNRNLVSQLYPKPPENIIEAQRRSRRVTRLISLLRAHRLIAKIPRSRRYRITIRGVRLIASVICLRQDELPKHLAA
jgi:hypothetical protein